MWLYQTLPLIIVLAWWLPWVYWHSVKGPECVCGCQVHHHVMACSVLTRAALLAHKALPALVTQFVWGMLLNFLLSLAWRFYFLCNLLPDYSAVSRMVSNHVCCASDFKMHCWWCPAESESSSVSALFVTWQHCCLPVLLSKGESRGSGPASSGWSFSPGSALHRGMWLSCFFSSVGLGMWSLFNYWGCRLHWGTR